MLIIKLIYNIIPPPALNALLLNSEAATTRYHCLAGDAELEPREYRSQETMRGNKVKLITLFIVIHLSVLRDLALFLFLILPLFFFFVLIFSFFFCLSFPSYFFLITTQNS